MWEFTALTSGTEMWLGVGEHYQSKHWNLVLFSVPLASRCMEHIPWSLSLTIYISHRFLRQRELQLKKTRIFSMFFLLLYNFLVSAFQYCMQLLFSSQRVQCLCFRWTLIQFFHVFDCKRQMIEKSEVKLAVSVPAMRLHFQQIQFSSS